MPKSDEILEEKPPEFYQFLSECIKVAEYRGTITYESIGEVIDQPAINTRHWAAAVSKEVMKGDNPMLSAVIVNKNDGTPGDGFYNLAYELGLLNQDPDNMEDDDKVEFWRNEIEQVYDTFHK